MIEQKTFNALYRKLLRLYPQEFRHKVGESMEQTFDDLCKEQKTRLFGFVLWMFIETFLGILQEHLLIKEIQMKNFLTSLRSPALISLILVVPFMIMEVVNRWNFKEGFPIPLFVFMWVLPVIFLATLMPIVRNVRAGNSLVASPVNLLIRVVILVFMAWMWTSILIDQMPCFLGVPNCD